MWNMQHVWKMKNVFKILMWNLMRADRMGNVGVDGGYCGEHTDVKCME
jgi:hypothetical protein